mmetsp:Transcript_23242/g.54432  ORF Transcript_23242/g.54432 Transcript_23242/m.54432 type:complete len:251 (-) Transcript_23242:413-1165(-)
MSARKPWWKLCWLPLVAELVVSAGFPAYAATPGLGPGEGASPQPLPSVGWDDSARNLEATLSRTSRAVAFLAQDAQALSQELRGLSTQLHLRRAQHRAPVRSSAPAAWQDPGTAPALLGLGASPPVQPVGVLSSEVNVGAIPSLPALQASMGNTDSMLAQAEADGPELALLHAFNTTTEESEDLNGGGVRCGEPGKVACTGFLKVYTFGYRLTVFWSTVNWVAIVMATSLCCLCCRYSLRPRRYNPPHRR